MRDVNQKILKFNHEKNLRDNDFFVSSSNKHVYDLLNDWPNWEKNFVNVNGENFSGKTHLINIFIKRFKGVIFDANTFDNKNLSNLNLYENIVLENLGENINEKLKYKLKKINLIDLKSRSKSFLIQNIKKPDDELIFALLVKNLSDRQIIIEKKLVNYVVKRIHRSYSKIFDFIYKIDEMSLKRKKSININLIKELLGE